MCKQITRVRAIELICKKLITSLNIKDRESHILDFWSLDDKDIEFHILSQALQNEILTNEYPIKSSLDPIYDELIILSLKSKYIGITNKFLETLLFENKLGLYSVYGDIEVLKSCPCCQYCTLQERGQYYICPLCFWEDDMIVNENTPSLYSSPNRMTLIDARKHFKKQNSKRQIKYKKCPA